MPYPALNRTVFRLGVNKNPEPEIVTTVPTRPLVGLRFETCTLETEVAAANCVKCVTPADAVRPDRSTIAVNPLGWYCFVTGLKIRRLMVRSG